jgi:hypothetical protein
LVAIEKEKTMHSTPKEFTKGRSLLLVITMSVFSVLAFTV